ncbi:hypothetical protein [Pelovirga terrestris]|uniref:PEP-CTERM protein-sorting domain-containing protein n=1 Tax=Pelovirga terrestris TaxID=2771352 RepID=A0A8J6QR31_9BACT|nr:hypothetical protein [Pelovirga terrestris]MBD1400583.1 hypothetical protein [Pelovirga terrestris]
MMTLYPIQLLLAACLMSLLVPAVTFAALPVDNLTVTFANGYGFAGVPLPDPVTFLLFVTGILVLLLVKRQPKNTEI